MTSLESVSSLRVVPRQERGKDKLVRLLDAADRILADEGIEAVTTTRVAAEAGVSVGSVYRYLPHREALLEALARGYLSQLEAEMDVLIEGSPGLPADRLIDAGVDAFAGFYRTHAGFRALWFSRHVSEEMRTLDRAHKRAMAHKIRTLLAAAGLGRLDRATLEVALAVQLASDALMQEAFRTHHRGDPRLIEELRRMLRGYLTNQ